MAKYKDENGNEVEGVVLTEAEINAKTEEAKAEALKALADSKAEFEAKSAAIQADLLALQKERDELAGKIDGGEGKGAENFKILKAALDKKDEEIKKLGEETKRISELRVTDYRNQMVQKLSGGNEELKKKINHHFDVTLAGVKAETQEEISAKLANAHKLSVDVVVPNAMDIAIGGGSRGEVHTPSAGAVEFSDREKALGNKLGITDEDRKKYGPRLTINKQ